jgi:nucleoside-diphosphate-sugar epimerase
MKVLVTGATGLIGAHAAAALFRAGHAVRLFVRDPSKVSRVLAPFGLGEGDVELVRGDLTDRASLDRALAGATGLLHSAGLFSADRRDEARVRRTNVEGTRLVLEATRDRALERIVYVSSILALFPPAGPVLRADDEVRHPVEMYAATKADAERLARAAQADRPVSIVYPAAVQGPDDPTFSVGPGLVADALRQGRVLVTEGGLPTTDVRDLAEVLVAVVEGRTQARRLMGPSFYVRHDDYHAILERITGRSLRAQRMPGWLLRALGRLGDLSARLGRPVQLTGEAAQVLTRSVPVDDAEARRLLGHAPIDAEQSFRDLIRWMVEAGHLDAASAGRAVAG